MRERREPRAICGELALEVHLRARRTLTVAHAWLVHAHGRIAGLLRDAPQNRAEAVGFAVRVFDAVATQPPDKKNGRRARTGAAVWTRDNDAHAVAGRRPR